MPWAGVELLNRHLEALRDLEAALLATEELGSGGTAEVPALCIGRVWVEGGRQRVLLKEVPLCIYVTVLDTDVLALDIVPAASAARLLDTRVVLHPLNGLSFIALTVGTQAIYQRFAWLWGQYSESVMFGTACGVAHARQAVPRVESGCCIQFCTLEDAL